MKSPLARFATIAAVSTAVIATAFTGTAGSNAGVVDNIKGYHLGIDCSLSGHPLKFHRDETIYQGNLSRCADADAFRADRDNRCVFIGNPAELWIEGWYRMNGNVAVKIPGLTEADVYQASKCNTKHWKWIGLHFKRV